MRSHTRTHTTRGMAAAALGLAVAAGAVGCGTETDPAGPVTDVDTAAPEQEPDPGSPRMREVAREWQGSEAERRWQEGYFPLDATVRLPDGGLREGPDQLAFDEGSLTLSDPLPGGGTRDGRIRWENGESRAATVISAEAAFGHVDSGAEWGGIPTLNVSGAELGEMRLRTSQGPAEVPAWLFTLDGYDTPMRIAAVTPPRTPPQAPVDAIEGDPGPAQPLEGLLSVADDGMSVTVVAGHGACDGGAEVDVLETEESLVFAGSVVNESDGPCTAQLLTEEITVELERPVGERAMLDAFTGELLLPEA